jgi:hypothetical protein
MKQVQEMVKPKKNTVISYIPKLLISKLLTSDLRRL